jgi:anhydro-N-acetylmuramic acid kinase
MIVKNESKIIERLLNSVLPIIDSVCICDTGSNDNTVALIESFMKNNNLKGEVFSEPFRNCGYNRNIALKRADVWGDYALLLDADMKQLIAIEDFEGAACLRDQIAVKTGITTLSDFRQKHIAAGGEGAPLAAYGDYLLFAHQTINRIILNIGGISNLTFLPAGAAFKNIMATDIGPGNKLMDLWVQNKHPELSYDKDGSFAKNGNLNSALLEALKSNPFFKNKFPRTTGPELFHLDYVETVLKENNLPQLSFEDVLSTLNHFTADTICDAIDFFISDMPNSEILVSGGGIHNNILLEKIEKHFKNIKVISTSAMGVNADAKEAILFALLANEHVAGDNKYFGEGGPSMPAVKMGKISFAD